MGDTCQPPSTARYRTRHILCSFTRPICSLQDSGCMSLQAVMNDSSLLRTNPLSSKSALPPFQIRGLDQILFHKDAFTQATPNSSHFIPERRLPSCLQPQTKYHLKSLPLSKEAAGASDSDSSTQENGMGHRREGRRSSIGDRNVQILRAINNILVSQVDSLRQALEETSHILRERQLDLTYISETELLAKDEIAELRQQLQEKEEIIRGKEEEIRKREEALRQRDKLLTKRDAGIMKQSTTSNDREIKSTKDSLKNREFFLSHLQKEKPPQTHTIPKIPTPSRQDLSTSSDPISSPDLTTHHPPLSKQSSLTKGKRALKEMLREQRDLRSQKSAIKANIRASRAEAKEKAKERKRDREGDKEAKSGRASETESASRASEEASKRPGLVNVKHAGLKEGGGGGGKGQKRSFVKLKEFVGRRRGRRRGHSEV